jgi:maltose/moltooligosaccharide transporter
MPRFRYGPIWIVGFGMFGITLLWPIYNAYVPLILQGGRPGFESRFGDAGFGLDPVTTGFIMTLDNLAALLILPFVGAWSDRTRSRWGRRKPFIAIGAPIAAGALAAIPFALGAPLWAFMAVIIVMVLAMDVFRTPLTALMPDLTPPEKRSQANGIVNIMGSIAGVLALVVGGMLGNVSPVAPFLFGASGMLIACIVVLTAVREPQISQEPVDTEPGLGAAFKETLRENCGATLLLLGGICCAFLAYSAIEVFFTSYVVDTLHLKEGDATILLGCFAASIVAAAYPAGMLGARIGRSPAMVLGMALFGGALVAGYSVQSVAAVQAMLVAAGVGWSLILVNSLPIVLEAAPPGALGTGTGLYLLSTQVAAILGPVLAGWALTLGGENYRVLFLYSPAMLVVAIGCMLGARAANARGSAAGRTITATH